jgi:sulfite reductase alpha subunit-like flavoprotein
MSPLITHAPLRGRPATRCFLLPPQGAAKVYVQDRLREAGARVWRLLQGGAHFYVCGDAGGMAPAVQEALLDVMAGNLVRLQLCVFLGL